MTAPSLAKLQVTEIAPGVDTTRDDEIIDWVKRAAETTYHPVGTCKMGADAMAVVDARLRVHGIAGLRVADASIMPTLTSGNTNAPSHHDRREGGGHGAGGRRLKKKGRGEGILPGPPSISRSPHRRAAVPTHESKGGVWGGNTFPSPTLPYASSSRSSTFGGDIGSA